jgi:hypothetical protein
MVTMIRWLYYNIGEKSRYYCMSGRVLWKKIYEIILMFIIAYSYRDN